MKNKPQSPPQQSPLNLSGGRLRRAAWALIKKKMNLAAFFAGLLIGFISAVSLGVASDNKTWVLIVAAGLLIGVQLYMFSLYKEVLAIGHLLIMESKRVGTVTAELAKLGRRDSRGRLLWREFRDVKLPEVGSIDHVLVCDMGVYCLEAKALQRRRKSDALVFDGKQILYQNEKPLPGSLIRQAKRNAEQLCGFLEAEGGEEYRVQPVVVFPGWNVRWTPDDEPDKAQVIVCGTRGKNTLSRIENNRRRVSADFLPLSSEKIKKIGDILEETNRRQ